MCLFLWSPSKKCLTQQSTSPAWQWKDWCLFMENAWKLKLSKTVLSIRFVIPLCWQLNYCFWKGACSRRRKRPHANLHNPTLFTTYLYSTASAGRESQGWEREMPAAALRNANKIRVASACWEVNFFSRSWTHLFFLKQHLCSWELLVCIHLPHLNTGPGK